MSLLNPTVEQDMVEFKMDECIRQGEALHEQYVNADPFPHVCIEDFLPREILLRVLDEFPQREKGLFDDEQSRLKTGYQLEKIKSRFITHLMYAFNSAQMLAFVGKLTGIPRLVSDPFYVGAGLHETARGGHLSIHADFNVHRDLNLIRRVNLLVFLNPEWDEAYGGNLELWDTDMKACRQSVPPLLGKAVLFNTTSDAFHGHPDPLQVPDGMFRRSIALYYYSAAGEAESVVSHSTLFQVRPGSEDVAQKASVGPKLKKLARDCVPPAIWRLVVR